MLLSPQNSYIDDLNPQMMVLGGKVFGRGLGHEGGAFMYKISALTKEATRDPLLSMNKEVGSHQTQNLLAPRATHFMVLCYNSPNGLREKKVTLKCSTFKKMNIYYLFFL